MNILIGENIKRLRKEKKITQEALAEHFNISSAAISKWENNETYPDITLLFPLANFFKVSIDELMGYNYMTIENEIKKVKEDIYNAWNVENDWEKAKKLVIDARRKYPNDYTIMNSYLFFIVGGLADNDKKLILENESEIIRVCDLLLEECNIENYRLDAIYYKAKLLYAKNEEEKALELLNNFPSFYHSSNQRIEQLYPKDSPKFYNQLTENLYELINFSGNKLGKYICYDSTLNSDEKYDKALKLYELYDNIHNDDDYKIISQLISKALQEIYHRSSMVSLNNNQINKLRVICENIK